MAKVTYQIHNLAVESPIKILGTRTTKRKRPNIKIIELKKIPQNLKSYRLLRLYGVDCFHKKNKFFLRFRKSLSSLEKSSILTHDLLPNILAAMGLFLFHGTLIENKNKTFLILGKSGAGKSTLSAAALRKKGSCWGDEASIVYKYKEKWYVTPAFSTLRNFADDDRSKPTVFGKQLSILAPPKHRQALSRIVILHRKSKTAKWQCYERDGFFRLRELMTHLFWPENMSPAIRQKIFQELVEFCVTQSPVFVDYPHRQQSQTLVLNRLLEFGKRR